MGGAGGGLLHAQVGAVKTLCTAAALLLLYGDGFGLGEVNTEDNSAPAQSNGRSH